jgi:hypothetical protein
MGLRFTVMKGSLDSTLNASLKAVRDVAVYAARFSKSTPNLPYAVVVDAAEDLNHGRQFLEACCNPYDGVAAVRSALLRVHDFAYFLPQQRLRPRIAKLLNAFDTVGTDDTINSLQLDTRVIDAALHAALKLSESRGVRHRNKALSEFRYFVSQ